MAPLPLEPSEEEGQTMETNPDESEETLYGEDITLNKDGGVRKKVLVEGDDNESPPKGCKALVHYVGTFLNGDIFDTSRNKEEPFMFELGKGVVIKGWDLAVPTMRVGEVCLLTISPGYAYGDMGSTNRIPPNTTLQFEMELMGWKGEDVTPDSAVTKITLKRVGDGYDKPNTGSTCSVHVIGKYKGQVFEDRELTYTQGEGTEYGLLPGVEEAIEKMYAGEIARVWIQPGRWSFGSAGKPEFNIPGDAAIDYEVELKTFTKFKEAWELSNDEKIETALRMKDKGSKYFRDGKYSIALKQYDVVIKLLDGYFNDEEKKRQSPLKLAGHLNLAACQLKLQNNFRCVKECQKALSLDRYNVKALFRRGKARFALNELETAKSDFKHVLQLDPKNKEAHDQLNLVNQHLKVYQQKERKIFANMFERLARQEEKEKATKQEGPERDVFKDAMEEAERVEQEEALKERPVDVEMRPEKGVEC